MEVFQQIREMDDADDEDGNSDNEFSKSIVWGFFDQAEETFQKMEEAMYVAFPYSVLSSPCLSVFNPADTSLRAKPDLPQLSSLGHFLKGSSAALGIIRVQASCEKMQHYGNMRDEEAGEALSPEEALKRITELLSGCKRDYQVAKRWLEKLYEDDG